MQGGSQWEGGAQRGGFQPFEELKGIGTVVYLLLLFCAGAC
jgi:hypothetical protein